VNESLALALNHEALNLKDHPYIVSLLNLASEKLLEAAIALCYANAQNEWLKEGKFNKQLIADFDKEYAAWADQSKVKQLCR